MKGGAVLLGLSMLLAAVPCAADVQVSLPLQGYYRAGRFMPVRVAFPPGETPQEITLSADGAVTTTVPMNASYPDVIVPFQVVREPLGPIRWSLADGRTGTIDATLTPLGETDCLVGFAGGDAGAAAVLFPGKTIISVPLDVAMPLHWPAVAWETLDAAVLDRLPEPPVSELLPTAGTALVVRSSAEPEKGVLPWRRVGDAWVMAHDPIGPSGSILPEAYGPTFGWKPGRDAGERRQLLLIAVLFAILTAAATLWRSLKSLLLIVALSAAFTVALVVRVRRNPPVVAARGVVVVVRSGVAQYDLWQFYKSMGPAVGEHAPQAMGRPVFASVQHFERSQVRLWCTPDGQRARYTFPLTDQTAIAFLSRGPGPTPQNVRTDPAASASPLWPLVREGYLGPGLRVAGELPSPKPDVPPPQQEFWPGVVIEESIR